MKKDNIAIIGAGGHARVVGSTILAAGYNIEGFYDDDPSIIGSSLLGIEVKSTEALENNKNQKAILAIGQNQTRKKMSQKFNLDWVSVMHPFSSVSPDVEIGVGTVICAGSIVQPGAKIGSHVIINTKSSIDHDTTVGDFAHISVAHLAGGASIEEGVFLALHSVVLPNVNIGKWSVVGAGAVATKNVTSNTTVVGIPARPIKIS